MEQVDEEYRDYYIGSDGMDHTEKPAIWDFIGDGLDTLEGVVGVGNIIKKQHYSGYDLDDKGHHGHKTQGAQKTDSFGGPVRPQMSIDQLLEADSNFDPVVYST